MADQVQSLVGRECWRVLHPYPSPSTFRLDFGNKNIRRRPAVTADDGPRQQQYVGDFVVRQWQAEWRIDDMVNGHVVATSFDARERNQRADIALASLAGATPDEASLSRPGGDCTIRFDNGIRLILFPTCVETDGMNYLVCGPTGVFGMGPYSRAVMQQPRSRE